MPKWILLIFVAFYVAAKVDQNDSKVPYIEDVLSKLNMDSSKEEFLHFERMIFWKVLRGNALIKTPFDQLGEILAHIESWGENVDLLRDISLVVMDNISQNFEAFNQEPAKVASGVIFFARNFLSVG